MALETIAVEGHRFSSIGEQVLLAAAADEQPTRPPTLNTRPASLERAP
jgi:hypothetical protein